MKKVKGTIRFTYFTDVDSNLKMEAVQRRMEAELLKVADLFGITVDITDSEVYENEL